MYNRYQYNQVTYNGMAAAAILSIIVVMSRSRCLNLVESNSTISAELLTVPTFLNLIKSLTSTFGG